MGILRLIELGCPVPLVEETTGVMGKVREDVSLRLNGSRHGSMNEMDEYLYSVLEAAAGSR